MSYHGPDSRLLLAKPSLSGKIGGLPLPRYREGHMAEKPLDKPTFIQAYRGKAIENLREAQACVEAGQPRAAITRSYYAVYQAANAWVVQHADKFDPDWPNAKHDELEREWRRVLLQIDQKQGVKADVDGVFIYGTLKRMRVQVDYKTEGDPGIEQARKAVASATRAVGWLDRALGKALEKAGK